MPHSTIYLPKYEKSHALIVGINAYANTGPLLHATNDATAVAEILQRRFNFAPENVKVLLDLDATRERILQAFLALSDFSKVGPNDRVMIFFAGHGHTVTGRRGETGFLVPVDGKADDLATLIRWDELTRNADLINAKHMLFLMDACYGGLALTRTIIPPGSMRFLKDMLQRYSRQVLTAGKADEVVSDAGGTRPGHSIFTSHLLDGLEGAIGSADAPITGHGLMAYVYKKVGGDPHSHQTPHFGFFDGDGDFIFDTSILEKIESQASSEPQADRDVFIKGPSFEVPVPTRSDTVADVLKSLVANPNDRIKLNDFINEQLRRAGEKLSQEKFPANDAVTDEKFASRLQQYEEAIQDLVTVVMVLAHWGEPEHVRLLERVFARISEVGKANSGIVVWLRLAWYPLLVLMYAAGISALAARRYDTLKVALFAPVYSEMKLSGRSDPPLVLAVVANLTEIAEDFKRLPDMERRYVPRSEHIYKKVQPFLEDELFLGRSYDKLFDDFEIFLALSFADIRDDDVKAHVWGPPGRFAWKERGRFSDEKVYSNFIAQVKSQGEGWAPLKEGFFRGSSKRFSEVADAYAHLLSQINWW
ncbi:MULTISPECIES: caspase family protein [Bradyrhizobium]|uniref:caspase family protein n=1 Tax=Bradyrhizobium TaxID=374 RepID=UPI0012FD5C35|nr:MULTISPECIES: caspase family protein [Bradyrhizobium]